MTEVFARRVGGLLQMFERSCIVFNALLSIVYRVYKQGGS